MYYVSEGEYHSLKGSVEAFEDELRVWCCSEMESRSSQIHIGSEGFQHKADACLQNLIISINIFLNEGSLGKQVGL